jgi:peptidyl-prolyl cis-trans isomerase SurA
MILAHQRTHTADPSCGIAPEPCELRAPKRAPERAQAPAPLEARRLSIALAAVLIPVIVSLLAAGTSVPARADPPQQAAPPENAQEGWTSTVQPHKKDKKEKKAAKKGATTTARAAPVEAKPAAPVTQSIVALVNDEPITGYEVEQRVTLSLMGTPELQQRMQARLKSPKINDQFKAFAIKRLQANPPKSQEEQQARVKQLQAQFVESMRAEVVKEFKPTARGKALDELIDERLKLQEAKRLDVVATKDDVDRILKGMAERNKMTLEEFGEHVGKAGGDINAMRERIKASLSWADVIRRKFGHQIVVSTRDVDKLVANIDGQNDVDLHVARILIATPTDQKVMARRMSDAERLRAGFRGCTTMAALAGGVEGARYDDLGDRRPSSLPEPTRSLLLNARDDEMLPPSLGEGGVELWALCGRKQIKVEETKRESVEGDLRQKEFEILAKKHLKDLRQDAHIEMR